MASMLGVSSSQYIERMVETDISLLPETTASQGGRQPTLSGVKAIARWEQKGVFGTFSDRPDSPEFARELRENSQSRDWSE